MNGGYKLKKIKLSLLIQCYNFITSRFLTYFNKQTKNIILQATQDVSFY